MNKPYFDKVHNHFMHFCHCGKWGMFGINVHLRAAMNHKNPDMAGTWFCAEHNPKKENSK